MVPIIFSVVSQFRKRTSREIIQSSHVQLIRRNSNNSRRIRRWEKMFLKSKGYYDTFMYAWNQLSPSFPVNKGKECYDMERISFSALTCWIMQLLWSKPFLPPLNSPWVQLHIYWLFRHLYISGKLATCCELAASEDGSRCLWTFSRSPEPRWSRGLAPEYLKWLILIGRVYIIC
mgnify:CR=1 FL=1